MKETLENQRSRESFEDFLTENERPFLVFWEDIERFLQLSTSADSIVANNMVSTISKKYRSMEAIPLEIREKITFDEQKDFEDRTELMLEIQNLLFDEMLLSLFPQFVASKRKDRPTSALAKSMLPDPFEDPDPLLVNYHKVGDQEILIAATPEKIIHFLTGEKGGTG